MKKTFFGFLALVACSVLINISACKKDDADDSGVLPAFVGLRANIGNRGWVADSTNGVIDKGMLTINGFKQDSKFTITIGGIEKGFYPIYGVTFSTASFLDSSSGTLKSYDTEVDEEFGGVIEITGIDTVNQRATGVFHFNLRNKLDNRLSSVEDGAFNISYRVASPDDDTTVNLHAEFEGNFKYFGSSGNFQRSVSMDDGEVRLLGSRIVSIYELGLDTTLRIEIEQQIDSGTTFFPTPMNNVKGAVQLIVKSKVHQSESGYVTITSYDKGLKELAARLSIQFDSDDSGGHFEIDGDLFYKHP